MDAIKKFFAGLSSSSSSSVYSSFEENVFGMIGVGSEDCGSQFIGTLVCVFVGLMGWIPIAKKSSRIAVDQEKIMLLSPLLDKKVVGTHRPSPSRGDASVGVQSGFFWPTLIRDRKLIWCEQLTLIQKVSKSVVFKKLHFSSKLFTGSSSSSSSSYDDTYHHQTTTCISSYDDDIKMPICSCGEVVVICTSWTPRNPGRRFYTCPKRGSRCTRFIGWYDPVMCERSMDIIPGFLRSKNALEVEIVMKNQQIKKLKLCLLACVIVIFLLILK